MLCPHYYNIEIVRGIDFHQMADIFFRSQSQLFPLTASFRLDRAPHHITHTFYSLLHEMFLILGIGIYHQIRWPARSFNSTSRHNFFWRLVREQIYQSSGPTSQQMQRKIATEIRTVCQEIFTTNGFILYIKWTACSHSIFGLHHRTPIPIS